MSADRILSTVRTEGVRFVRFVWTDNAGLIRAKAVHTVFLDRYLAGERVGITAASPAMPVMYDAVADGAGLSPAGEAFLQADWDTFTVLPYAPGWARVLCDVWDETGPWGHCPRSFLRRMAGHAADGGIEVMAAFENEFYLLRPDGAPLDATVFAQSAALDGASDVLLEIAEALESQGVRPEQVYAESGGGQFELPVRYADVIRAADHQVIFRETVHAVARRHGLRATFLPKPWTDRAGSGAHLHLSLWRDGRNVVADPDDGSRLSAVAERFCAGILSHLPALMAITAPSHNSFKRFQPHSWSGAYTCWGYGNREAAIRIPPSGQPGGPLSNFELKTSDATANPYLSLGAVIAAGLDGVRMERRLPEPVAIDPANLAEAERANRGIRRLPSSLGDALAALDTDRVLLDALGPALARSYLAVKKLEWNGLRDMTHEDEVKLLLERY
ncbi:MAG: glutamine synthetase [Dehalococcoidia bacterium]|nr:MAG: glutamine synthetase [Dehalococcoidia bacterium]